MASILIVGGGFAGLTAAQALRKAGGHRVTLVDRKDYFEVTPAQLHVLVAPGALGDRPWFLYKEVLGEAFVQGEVQSLEDHAALLDGNRRLTFDFLILATGTRYPRFATAKPTQDFSLVQRRETLGTESRRFQDAKSFLIVGGGLVGVELAGEIASAAPGKPIRLAHRGPRLVENLSPRASQEALDQLGALGVKVLLNTADAVPSADELVYDATTPEPSTGFLGSVPSVLDDRGRVLVDDGFRVPGHAHWFAIGDVNASPHAKQAVAAASQGQYVAGVILGSTQAFRPQPAMALVPLGARRGFSQLPFGVVKWKFLLNLKRKDYLVGRIRQQMGA